MKAEISLGIITKWRILIVPLKEMIVMEIEVMIIWGIIRIIKIIIIILLLIIIAFQVKEEGITKEAWIKAIFNHLIMDMGKEVLRDKKKIMINIIIEII